MSYSIYDASIVPMARALGNLSKIIDKAVAQAKTDDKPEASLTEAFTLRDGLIAHLAIA